MIKFRLSRGALAWNIASLIEDMKESTSEEPLHYELMPEDGTLVLIVCKGDYKINPLDYQIVLEARKCDDWRSEQ